MPKKPEASSSRVPRPSGSPLPRENASGSQAARPRLRLIGLKPGRILPQLLRLLKRVATGERVLLLSPGMPVLGLLPLSDLEMIGKLAAARAATGKAPKQRRKPLTSVTVEDLARDLEERAERASTGAVPRRASRGGRRKR